MAFEWLPFLDAHRIHYVTSGPNVSRGNIAVHCPFCGSSDDSQHMSISVAGKGWRCWRHIEHRGKSPVSLVQALMQTTRERAMAIVGDAVFLPDDFMGAVMSKMVPPKPPERKTPLILPPEFKPIKPGVPSVRRFVDYLTGPSRRFTEMQVYRMTRDFDLRYAPRGTYKGRVIFPVIFEHKLVTWTGRSIYSTETLRYRTLSDDPELEDNPASGPISDYLLWYDDIYANADNCDTLVLCEGPFDALKVSVIGLHHGITATCFFTASPSRRQIELLHDAALHYKRRFLLLDRNTLGTAMRVRADMAALKFDILMLPSSIKDPGLLTDIDLRKIMLD